MSTSGSVRAMSKLTVLAKLTAAEGKSEELEAALAVLIEAAEEEPELEIYSVHKDPENEGVYHFFELYTTKEAFAVHGKGEKMQAAMGALGALLGAAPEVVLLDPVAAKGMSL